MFFGVFNSGGGTYCKQFILSLKSTTFILERINYFDVVHRPHPSSSTAAVSPTVAVSSTSAPPPPLAAVSSTASPPPPLAAAAASLSGCRSLQLTLVQPVSNLQIFGLPFGLPCGLPCGLPNGLPCGLLFLPCGLPFGVECLYGQSGLRHRWSNLQGSSLLAAEAAGVAGAAEAAESAASAASVASTGLSPYFDLNGRYVIVSVPGMVDVFRSFFSMQWLHAVCTCC